MVLMMKYNSSDSRLHLNTTTCNASKNYLNRLADLILVEIGKRGCSCICFVDLCGISRNKMGKIVNRKKTDIKLSIILKICENSEISIEDVFGISDFKLSDVEVVLRHNGRFVNFYPTRK